MKNVFQHTLLMGLVMFGLCACGKGGRTLTSATGTIYECLVVINSQPLDFSNSALSDINNAPHAGTYQGDIATTYDLVASVMGADMPCLPQMEPYFQLTEVKTAAFDDFLKPTRNILYVDIDPTKYTQTKAKIARDYWSHPQAFYRIQAPSDEAFVAYWLEHGEEVRDWFVREELRRQGTFYKASTNKKARAAMDKTIGCDMLIPEDYMLIMDTTLTTSKQTHLIWCCNSKGSLRRDVVVYAYPYADTATFTADYLSRQRDRVLSQVMTSSSEESRMGTEYRIFPPQMRFVSALQGNANDFYAAELRGLWKMYGGESMGGPFVSLTRVDEMNHRVVTAETFIFASGQKKRNELRKAEAILYTLLLPQERNIIEEINVKAED